MSKKINECNFPSIISVSMGEIPNLKKNHLSSSMGKFFLSIEIWEKIGEKNYIF